jgi:hypothetical protein
MNCVLLGAFAGGYIDGKSVGGKTIKNPHLSVLICHREMSVLSLQA